MPELTDPKTPTKTSTDDPLSGLFHMSTTAGRGTQEYVAINKTAVAAALLGLLSLLALMHPLLLVVPVAAIVCAVIGVAQIGRSNGTQTGRAWALAGMALGTLIGGFVIARQATTGLTQRADRRTIAGLVARLGDAVKARDYDAAYALFSDEFRRDVPMADFRTRWESLQVSAELGGIEAMRWNELVEFDPPSPVTGDVIAYVGAMLKFEKGADESRLTCVVLKRNGNWQIRNVPTLWPPDRGRPPPREGGPGGDEGPMGP